MFLFPARAGMAPSASANSGINPTISPQTRGCPLCRGLFHTLPSLLRSRSRYMLPVNLRCLMALLMVVALVAQLEIWIASKILAFFRLRLPNR